MIIMYHNHDQRNKRERKIDMMSEEVKANQRIRKAFDETGLPKWKIADRLGIHYSTLSVWMRHEMPEEKQEKILQMIKEESARMRMPAGKQSF